MPQPLRVFLSYAHEDDRQRIELEKALKLLERQGLIEPWSDRKLLPGQSWGRAIDEQIERADLILLLVSHDFLASDYCWGVEVQRALERREAGEAMVVPILLRAADWESAPFGKLQALPADARPVKSWDREDEAWTDISKGLRRLIAEAQGRQARSEPGGPQEPPDPGRYLETLLAAHSYVELRGMGAKVAERLPLDRVYTRLRVAQAREAGRGKRPPIPSGEKMEAELWRAESGGLELREVLPAHPHAVLIGDPGSGKTTFLRFVAQVLARALLEGSPEAVETKLGLEGGISFPVFVRLSHFAEFLARHQEPSLPADAPEHLFRFLAFRLKGHLHGLPENYLDARIREGGCFLLLDGLDEVPQEHRDEVARVVEALVREVGESNRLLVACRTRAYQGMAQLAHLESFKLAPFESAQVEAFVGAWSKALFKVDPGSEDTAAAREAESYRQSLSEAIGSHPSVGPLTDNPLMLTMLSVVHWNRKRLPEQRADLYEEAVSYLLESRKEQSEYPSPLRREALQALALRMLEDREGVQRSLGRTEAAEAVAPVLAVDRTQALDFLDNEALHSGLLTTRTEGEFEFWHLTFQEYLGALELAMSGEYWETIRERLEDDRWGEVVLLLAGCLRRAGGVRAARRLVEKLLADAADVVPRARAVAWIGRILADIAPYGGDASAGTGYAEALDQTMRIFEPGEPVAESLRVEVGEALGQAGDPRLVDPGALRVELPAGTFWLGAQSEHRDKPVFDEEAFRDESPRHVRVSAFALGRYPVTVQEFRTFVEKGGYRDPRLWDPTGWAWRENKAMLEPDAWDRQIRTSNRPVTGVSWYEADAYCRWVGGRLPTEAEWEYAARGSQGRRFPWPGDALPTDAHANFEGRVGRPTAVGIYPLGATPEGVQDLAGNVWEWCQDWFGKYAKDDPNDPSGPASGSSRVLRGGSWDYDPIHLRSAYRLSYPPENRYDNIGFRVLWSSGGLA